MRLAEGGRFLARQARLLSMLVMGAQLYKMLPVFVNIRLLPQIYALTIIEGGIALLICIANKPLNRRRTCAITKGGEPS